MGEARGGLYIEIRIAVVVGTRGLNNVSFVSFLAWTKEGVGTLAALLSYCRWSLLSRANVRGFSTVRGAQRKPVAGFREHMELPRRDGRIERERATAAIVSAAHSPPSTIIGLCTHTNSWSLRGKATNTPMNVVAKKNKVKS